MPNKKITIENKGHDTRGTTQANNSKHINLTKKADENKNKIMDLHRQCREAEVEAKRLEEEKKKEAEEEAQRNADTERELLETPPLVIDDVQSVEKEPSTSTILGPILELVSSLDIKKERLSPVLSESFRSFEEITAGLVA